MVFLYALSSTVCSEEGEDPKRITDCDPNFPEIVPFAPKSEFYPAQ